MLRNGWHIYIEQLALPLLFIFAINKWMTINGRRFGGAIPHADGATLQGTNR